MKHKNLIVISLLSIFMFIGFIGCGDTNSAVYNNNQELAESYDTWSLSYPKQSMGNGEYTGSYELSGCDTIWQYSSDKQFDLQVPYNLTVKNGKAKIILITPDNEVKTLVENTSKSSVKDDATFTLPIDQGLNRIKIVGYQKANIQVQLKIDEGIFQKVGF